MKQLLFSLLAALLLIGSPTWAVTTADGVSQATVSVTSASTPVSLIAPAFRHGGWQLRVRTTAAVPLLVFVYTGTLGGSPPSDVYEVAPGESLNDNILNNTNGADIGIGVGVAAVLESGVAPVTADVIWR